MSNEKLKSGLSPRTVERSLLIFRHALDTAVKMADRMDAILGD